MVRWYKYIMPYQPPVLPYLRGSEKIGGGPGRERAGGKRIPNEALLHHNRHFDDLFRTSDLSRRILVRKRIIATGATTQAHTRKKVK